MYAHSSELYHYGVLGMKWGVRKQQKQAAWLSKKKSKQIKSINSLYDHANKWTNRKVSKLEKKGKTAKANVWKYAAQDNERARKQRVKEINSLKTKKDYKRMRRQARMDYWLGGQNYAKANFSNNTTLLSRINEYSMQRGARWASNFTLNSTLARMTPSEGYQYLRKKTEASKAAARSASYYT